MDWFEESFLSTCEMQPWAYFRYIDDIFIIWTGSIKELQKFLQAFNNFHPSIKLDWKYTSKETPQVEFLDVVLSIKDQIIVYICIASLQIVTSTFNTNRATLITLKQQVCTAKFCASVNDAAVRKMLKTT